MFLLLIIRLFSEGLLIKSKNTLKIKQIQKFFSKLTKCIYRVSIKKCPTGNFAITWSTIVVLLPNFQNLELTYFCTFTENSIQIEQGILKLCNVLYECNKMQKMQWYCYSILKFFSQIFILIEFAILG